MNWMRKDREEASNWARNVLADPLAIILDTETTGVGDDAEIVQIAIIDVEGHILLDALVKPTQPIPADSTRVHGISDADVADAPPFSEFYCRLCDILGSASRVVIYNASYDWRIFCQTCWVYRLTVPDVPLGILSDCAMHWYAQWFGEWSDYHGSYWWQPLPSGDHRALGDCRATLRLIQEMAGGQDVGSN